MIMIMFYYDQVIARQRDRLVHPDNCPWNRYACAFNDTLTMMASVHRALATTC